MHAAALVQLLADRGATLGTAESLTGGRLAARITGVPGASACYVGGVVTYATALKVSLLGVPEDLVAEHGVVSAPCAAAMAEGARSRLGAAYAVATTGVAGPASQEGHPPGTVHVAAAGPGGVEVRTLALAGSREEVQERTCDEALDALGWILRGEEQGLG